MSAGKLAVRSVLVSALTVTLVPVLGASPAFACKCVVSSDRENLERADVVFKATVRKSTRPTTEQEQASGSLAPVVYEFAPSRVYKGTVTTPQRVSTSSSSASCGVSVSGQGSFLVFAYKRDAADRKQDGRGAPKLGMSSCGGTRALEKGEKPAIGKGKPVKSAAVVTPTPAVPATPTPTPTVTRSAAAVPANVALPAVAALLGITLGAAAWATRRKPVA